MPEDTQQYKHQNQAIQRPDVGVQDQFQTKRAPKSYRYDSSLDPQLSWDEQRARALAEWLLELIERAARQGEATVFAKPEEWKGGGVRVSSTVDAVAVLKSISQPFLNWAGKAERQEIEIATLPLFVHERHSTKAILDGIQHRKAKGLTLDLFSDAELDIRDRLEAYEHTGPWQNRMILGDSLTVMNSLLEYEGLGGQVQMLYFDPPYGVKFGSNFQPFVRKNSVTHGSDAEMIREPEMVKAYRDTWELGLHSYLTYLRDRLALAKELLAETGSIFVQISDDNVHHVREVLDEVFPGGFVSQISFQTTSGFESSTLPTVGDFLLWYAKDRAKVRYNRVFRPQELELGKGNARWVLFPDGTYRGVTAAEARGDVELPPDVKLYKPGDLQSQGAASEPQPFEYRGKTYRPSATSHWKANYPEGMQRLADAGRIHVAKNSIQYIRFSDDFPFEQIGNIWTDTRTGSFTESKVYVVQTNFKVVERCLHMTTNPGDLVVDITCGSGTTALVAEHWGRRWITMDTSRVPIALARQRLLTSTFPWYRLKEPSRGPAGGFVYERKKNGKGEEIGGLVPRITLKSIANGDEPKLEVLVERAAVDNKVTRVCGPFTVEAIIAPVQPLEQPGSSENTTNDVSSHLERMTEVLRRSKTLQLPGNRKLSLAEIRRTADTEYLHAEAMDGDNRIAIVFGPEDGAISSITVYEAAREAHFLKYDRLFFFGFAIQAKAREMLEDTKQLRIPAAYVAVTPDVAMADLLKTTRASEIFSITGLPDFDVRRAKKKGPDGNYLHEAKLLGLDIFDPETLESEAVDGQNLPCWMLDTDYDGMCFYATQVFFPKTSAWDSLQKSLKANFEDSVWEHLGGTVSEPFAPGEHRRVAVKVIDERGNELMRVRDIEA